MSSGGGQDDLNDLQSNMAIKLLQEALTKEKISQEIFEDNKKRFYRLHDTIIKIF